MVADIFINIAPEDLTKLCVVLSLTFMFDKFFPF